LEFASVRRPFILVGVAITIYVLEHPTGFLLTEGKHMTMNEVLEALEKSGIEFEVTAEHEDAMHVIVKFDPEEDADD
jgi:histidinol phosphatase-like PHP family hydrolase